MKFSSIGLAVIVLAAGLAWGDVIERKDGSQVEGTIQRVSGGWQVTSDKGTKTVVRDEDVRSISKGAPSNPADAAQAALASLRRMGDKSSDPSMIIDRYERFLAQYKDTPSAADAQKDLKAWKDRRQQGMVKVGDEWLTAAQQQAMMAKIVPMIEEARSLIKQNRTRDAEAAVKRLIAVDPKNPAGLYLKGVVAYKSDRLPEAREAWEAVRSILPDHAPTLNNLGVLMFRQRQALGALALYDQAMQASPTPNVTILDNVAEAMNIVPEKQQDSLTYRRAADRFNAQELQLEKTMNEKGLYRWGSTWVDADKRKLLQAAEEKIKAKLDALQVEYNRVADRIREINTQIQLNDKDLERINNDRTFIDSSGLMTQLPAPSIYYQIRRNSERLELERDGLKDRLRGFQARANQIQQERPVPKFTGVQRIVEAEGVPLTLPGGAPARVPTTQPAGSPPDKAPL